MSALEFRVRLLWSRLLDVVRPRRDYAGRYPRIHTASRAEAQRIEEILRRSAGQWIVQDAEGPNIAPVGGAANNASGGEPADGSNDSE